MLDKTVYITGLKFTLCKGFFSLKTGVISARLRLSGKFPAFNMSLKMLCKVSAETSELILNILGGILSLVHVFLGLISWTYLSTSNLDIGLKENLSWFTILLLMSKILGWNLYLVIAFSIESEIFIESGLIMQEFSLTSKVETASLVI